MHDTPRYATLRDYLRVVRERRLLIVIVTLVGVVAAFASSARKDPEYGATAKLSLREISDPDSSTLGTGLENPFTISQLTALYVSSTASPENFQAAQQALGRSLQQMRAAVNVQAETSTGFIVIRTTARSARDAADVANAVGTAAVDRVTRDTRKRYRQLAHTVGLQIKSLGAGRRDSVNYAQLVQRRFQLLNSAKFSRPLALVERAAPNTTPLSPRPVRDSVLGGILGLFVGLLLAFVRDSVDATLRRSTDIEHALDLPVVGRIRRSAFGTTGLEAETKKDALGPDSEAVAILRKNVEFLDVDRPPKTVMVTSAQAGEGKSTVAMRLAVASAAAGRRTLLVDCDFRRPVVAQRLGLDASPGLVDYLQGNASPGDIVRAVHLPEITTEGAADHQLAVITAGSQTTRVSELLASEAMKSFLRSVADVYDLVVVDTGPLLAVADPLELAPNVDAVLLCVRAGQTRRSEAVAARAALQRVPPRPTAAVATNIDVDRDQDYVPYAYYSAPGSHARV